MATVEFEYINSKGEFENGYEETSIRQDRT